MNRDSARAFVESSLKLETVSFNSIPGQTKLFLDFQADSAAVDAFYPEKRAPLKNFAKKVLANYKIDRNELCDALRGINKDFGTGAKTLENIELLRQADCLAIVSGQQAGIFSGALYTIYKALSAVRLCEELKRQDIKAVPVFWIAEEDHDFDEIKKTFVLAEKSASGNSHFIEIENEPKNSIENLPVGSIALDETINETIGKLSAELPQTNFTIEIKELIAASYQPGETFSTAFAKFLTKIFAPYGLIFLSPLNKTLKRLCAPIFADAIENSGKIVSRLLERNAELAELNYPSQVLVEKDSFPFFLLDENGARKPLRRDPETGKIKVQNSKIEFDEAELGQIAAASPQSLSPNALLRPVAQDYLLPTLAYFGGAAEIAYFAQNSVIYEILNRPATPIRHRASFTIIEPKTRRSLDKYQLRFNDLFTGKEKLLAQIVEKYLNRETARVFADVEEIINTQLNRLDRHLLESEPTLVDNSANRRRKILWHIGALRKKYHRAEILKHEIAHRRIETLFASLLPHNALQERTLNVLTFLNIYGENFIDWVYNAIETEEKEHRLLYL